LVDHYNDVRDLVPGEVGGHMVAYHVCIGRGGGVGWDDEGDPDLPEAGTRCGCSQNRNGGDPVERGEGVLHLGGVHVVAATYVHLGGAAHQTQVAVVAHPAQVPGVEPTVGVDGTWRC
jgi:hypothetical protein